MINELQNKIAAIVPTLHGWASIQKAQTLASLVVALRPRIVVEIGIHAGRSAIPMLMAMKEINHGKLIAIDAWSAEVAAKNEVKQHADFWKAHNLEDYHKTFVSKLDELKLADFCEIHKAKSDDVEPPDGIGLAHIDGSHTDQAITDVERFAPKVVIGGIVVLDDLNWISNSVKRAYDDLVDMGFIELYRVHGTESATQCTDDWCVMQRIK